MNVIKFPNNAKGLALFDSGATTTLISQSTIDNNGYLSSLPQQRLDTRQSFLVGGGTRIYAKRVITFEIILQDQTFVLTAHVVACIGGVDLLVGTRALEQLEANLCFRTKTLRFKPKTVFAKLNRSVILRPGESKIVTIRTRVPDLMKSSDMYFQPTRYCSQFAPSMILVKLSRGVTKIALHNFSKKTKRLNNRKPVGSILVKQFGNVPIPLRTVTENRTEPSAR